jgi:hypothetical protein
MVYSLYEMKSESPDGIASRINLESAKMYKCPKCGRLIVFWDRRGNEPIFYNPEPNE